MNLNNQYMKGGFILLKQPADLTKPKLEIDQELKEIKKDIKTTEITAKIILERLKRVLGKEGE